MNARILKKLCAKAYPHVLLMFSGHWPRDGRFFRADPHDDSCWQDTRMERKSLQALLSEHGYFTPLAGTLGFGWTSGWESPEWEDEAVWYLLAQHVHEHFTDYRYPEPPRATRRLRNPADLLRAARELYPAPRRPRRAARATV